MNTMDEIEDFKTYVPEYLSWKAPRHGDAVFTDLDDTEGFLFKVYPETTPDLPRAGHDGSMRPAVNE